MNERISESSLKDIRIRLNAAYSSVIVYGTGVDSNIVPVFSKNKNYQHIISPSRSKEESWKLFVEKSQLASQHPFFDTLIQMNKETEEMGVPNFSTHYVLKTSILDTLPNIQSAKGFKLIEINGNVCEAFNPIEGVIEKIEAPEQVTPLVESTFPNGNYDSKKRVVANFEAAYRNDFIQIALFMGASGDCPVVASMYNRALVNKSFIVVVNTDKDCFMHDLANISIKGDAIEFLDDLYGYYNKGN